MITGMNYKSKKNRKPQVRPEPAAAKVTISLPASLLKDVDRMAREQSTTRSGVFQKLLIKEQRAAVYRLMEEGYREYAEETRQMVGEMWPLVAERMRELPPWDEGDRANKKR